MTALYDASAVSQLPFAAPEPTRAASPLRRLAANILDAVVLSAGILTVTMVAAASGNTEATITALVGGLMLSFVAQMLLWARGRTVGKLLLKTQVVVERTGTPAGFLRMAARETFGKFLSGLFLGLGFFWLLFDSKHQGWHDKLVSTVVRTKAS